jgi:hypothetical protein
MVMMLIENKFNIGDTVYLKTDTDQNERIVTGLNIRLNSISYALSCGENESYHYEFEISKEKNILKKNS